MYVCMYVCGYIHMQLYTFDVFLCWSPCWVDSHWSHFCSLPGPQFETAAISIWGRECILHVCGPEDRGWEGGITTRRRGWYPSLVHISVIWGWEDTRTLACFDCCYEFAGSKIKGSHCFWNDLLNLLKWIWYDWYDMVCIMHLITLNLLSRL